MQQWLTYARGVGLMHGTPVPVSVRGGSRGPAVSLHKRTEHAVRGVGELMRPAAGPQRATTVMPIDCTCCRLLCAYDKWLVGIRYLHRDKVVNL